MVVVSGYYPVTLATPFQAYLMPPFSLPDLFLRMPQRHLWALSLSKLTPMAISNSDMA